MVPKHYFLSSECGIKHFILEAKITLNNVSLRRETLIMFVGVCLCGYVQVSAGACSGQKRALEFLELEF